jgi:DNA polymerase-3 subunit delta
VRQKTEEIKSGFIDKKDKGGFNVIRLSGDKLDYDRFTQEVQTVPFLSEKKMVIIDDLCSNMSAGQKKIKDEVFDFLSSHENKIENNLLFIDVFEEEKKIPAKDKLFNYLKKQKYSWYLPSPKSADLSSWIKNYCVRQEIKITIQAISELVLLVGNDLSQMANELDKLKAYKNGEPITPEDVRVLVRAKYNDDIFKLTDAMAGKNRRLALELVSQQLLSGNEPLSLLGSINWQFKILLKIKSILEANPRESAGNIAVQIGAHPFVVSKNMTAVRNFTLPALIKAQNELLKIEIQLKSGTKNPELLFDLFIANNS